MIYRKVEASWAREIADILRDFSRAGSPAALSKSSVRDEKIESANRWLMDGSRQEEMEI